MKRLIVNFLFGGPGAVTWLGDLGLLVLRLGMGLLMAIGHGWGKVYSDGRIGPGSQMISGVESMGFPAPTLFAWLAMLAEFLGGILLAAGLCTRPAALALTFNMAVAAFVVHGKDPLFMTGTGPSKEPALLFLLPFFCLLLTGAGRFSADTMIRGGKGG